jgi:hypothetical protein
VDKIIEPSFCQQDYVFKKLISRHMITIFISHSFLSKTWHVKPDFCNLPAKSAAHFPVTEVNPSVFKSVMPSTGASPFFGIAK